MTEAEERHGLTPETGERRGGAREADDRLRRIVSTVLYEGYILYPYRPDSAKNRVRWTFGGIHPPAYAQASGGTEPSSARVTCLLAGGADAGLDVSVGFLRLLTRTVERCENAVPAAGFDPQSPPASVPVDALTVDGAVHRSWEEAEEARIDGGRHRVAELARHPVEVAVVLPEGIDREAVTDEAGVVAGLVTRRREPLSAALRVSAAPVRDGLWQVRVEIVNVTPFECTGSDDRACAMRRALVSAHAVLRVSGVDCRWLSLADPPEDAAEAAEACTRQGLWPLLVDADDTVVLASPIILEDHPEVAPESPGDLFDSTEIDEILTLRIMTLTDEEKAEMRAADPRSRAILERTERLGAEEMARMHGTLRTPPRWLP